MADFGQLHHVELRTTDFGNGAPSWDWLLDELRYESFQNWSDGKSWRNGATYIVLEVASHAGVHDRRLPGLSHLAFHAGDRATVDRLWQTAAEHGWRQLYAERYPWAGGSEHYAAYLENDDRFKVELVAAPVEL